MWDKKTLAEIEILAAGGKILADILNHLASLVKPGVTGYELDRIAEEMIEKAGGQAAFKNYQGFPNALCFSVNKTVVHGIPSKTPLKEGDIVGLNLGLKYKGLYTDAALTVPVGKVSKAAPKLIKTTAKALDIALQQVKPGNDVNDIGKAVEAYIRPFGYGIVRDLAGHGVGRAVHEDPWVPNFDFGKNIGKLYPGLVIAIEPMIILGGNDRVVTASDNWGIETFDQSLAAHFEHTVAVTESGYKILTK